MLFVSVNFSYKNPIHTQKRLIHEVYHHFFDYKNKFFKKIMYVWVVKLIF